MKQKTKEALALSKKGLSARKIAVLTGLSKSTVHRIIKANCPMGQVSGVPRVSQDTRFEIHNYQMSMKILESPKGWSPNAILRLKKLKFESLNRNTWTEYMFNYNNVSVHITPNRIIMFPEKLQSKISAEDAQMLATSVAMELIPRLESLLEIKISNKPSVYITVSRNHAAMINDKIFDVLDKAGFKQVKDDNGNLRLILDRSNGEKHIECTDPINAVEDMSNLDKFIKAGLTGKYDLKTMHDSIITLQKFAKKLIDSQGETPQDNSIPPPETEPVDTPDYIM